MGNGVTVSNTASVSQQQIIDSLTAQLAKANERVKELEQERESFKLRISKQKEIIGRHAKEAAEIAKPQEQFVFERQIEALERLYCLVVTAGEPVTAQSVRGYIDNYAKGVSRENNALLC